jgi:hypothetical protein
MTALLLHLIGRAHEYGRDHLLVPLDHLPEIASRMEESEPEIETRALRWNMTDPVIERPYTDLRYW